MSTGIKRISPPTPTGEDSRPPPAKSAKTEHEDELLRDATWNMECIFHCLRDELLNKINKDLFCIEYGTQNELVEKSGFKSAENENFKKGNAFLEGLIFNHFTKEDFDVNKIFMDASNLLGRVLVQQPTDVDVIAIACFQICCKFHLIDFFPFAVMAKYCGCSTEKLVTSEQKVLNIVGFDITRCTTSDILRCIYKFHDKENRVLALQIIDRAEWLTVVIQRDCASKYMDCAKTMAVGALLSAADELHNDFNVHVDCVFNIPEDISKQLFTQDAEDASEQINSLLKEHPAQFERWKTKARGSKNLCKTYHPESVVLNPAAKFKFTTGSSHDPFCTPLTRA
tara:strand:- start:978 stop:1997 length:1020 start_codon:yes stop_codon:yes gene_type:complete